MKNGKKRLKPSLHLPKIPKHDKEEFSTMAVWALQAPSEVMNKFQKNHGSVYQGRNETPMSNEIKTGIFSLNIFPSS